jgi:hypothetical protein
VGVGAFFQVPVMPLPEESVLGLAVSSSFQYATSPLLWGGGAAAGARAIFRTAAMVAQRSPSLSVVFNVSLSGPKASNRRSF